MKIKVFEKHEIYEHDISTPTSTLFFMHLLREIFYVYNIKIYLSRSVIYI